MLIETDAVRLAGQAGTMAEVPLMFDIGDRVTCGKVTVEILGHARFSYGRGFWEEFWGLTDKGASKWVSVDEGDIVMQMPIPAEDFPEARDAFAPGQTLVCQGRYFDIVEIDSAECVAIRGRFDEPLTVGETYRFVNAQSDDGMLLSGEIWPGGAAWFLGYWFDPFEIRVRKGA